MLLASFLLAHKFCIVGVYPVRPPVPAVGGYEGVGEIQAVGSAVKDFSLGDWVIPSPLSFGIFFLFILF